MSYRKRKGNTWARWQKIEVSSLAPGEPMVLLSHSSRAPGKTMELTKSRQREGFERLGPKSMCGGGRCLRPTWIAEESRGRGEDSRGRDTSCPGEEAATLSTS